MPDSIEAEIDSIVEQQNTILRHYKIKNPKITKQEILQKDFKYRSLEDDRLNRMQLLEQRRSKEEEPEEEVNIWTPRIRGRPRPWDLDYWKI